MNKTATLETSWRNLLAFALLSLTVAGRAEGTNALARVDFQAFKIITDRNIFNPNRSSRSTRNSTERPVRVESFALVGTMSYEKGDFAFFDGSGSQFKSVLKAGETIGGYKITEITPTGVKLEANGQQKELLVGMQMKKEDEGEWQVSARPAAAVSASAPASSGTGSESTSSGEESEILKRLMLQREQEITK